MSEDHQPDEKGAPLMHLLYLVIAAFLCAGALTALTRFLQDAAKRKHSRMKEFEQIGAEWIKFINKEIPGDCFYRNPLKEMRELLLKKEEVWIISYPTLRKSDPDDHFEILLTIHFIDWNSQMTTSLRGLPPSQKRGPWWAPADITPLLTDTWKKLNGTTLVFNATNPEAP